MATSDCDFSPIKKINLSHRLVDYFVQEIESGVIPDRRASDGRAESCKNAERQQKRSA